MNGHRPPHLFSEAALEAAMELLAAVFAAAKRDDPGHTRARFGEAIGFGGEDPGRHVTEMFAGTRQLTLPKILQGLANDRAWAHAFVAALTARLVRQHGGHLLGALDALAAVMRECLALAMECHEATADRRVDDDEAAQLRARFARMRRAIQTAESALLPPRPEEVS